MKACPNPACLRPDDTYVGSNGVLPLEPSAQVICWSCGTRGPVGHDKDDAVELWDAMPRRGDVDSALACTKCREHSDQTERELRELVREAQIVISHDMRDWHKRADAAMGGGGVKTSSKGAGPPGERVVAILVGPLTLDQAVKVHMHLTATEQIGTIARQFVADVIGAQASDLGVSVSIGKEVKE